jgi:glutamine amidotransferase
VCRFVAYLGPPVTLESLLLDPPHSLRRQAFAPRHQGAGRVNADGFGVGWYDRALRPEPARYRTTTPMWADRSFASLAGLVASGAVLAAVRDATPPSPIEASGVAPFTHGPWLFAHNGAVDGWGHDPQVRRALTSGLSAESAARIEGAADSETLFALVLDRLAAGDSMGDALAAVTTTVLAVAPARLNMVLTDGQRLAATVRGSSMFVLDGGESVILASEPFDDVAHWRPLDAELVVEAEPGRMQARPLETR